MYESFFGLREAAFSLSPDPRFLWLSETHREGLSALTYAITARKGFALLTGGIGNGKTTLLRAALARLPAEIEVGLVTQTAGLGPLDLLRLVEVSLGIEGPEARGSETVADHLIALQFFLHEQARAGLQTVLVIDETQNLDGPTLEQVRLLSNLETEHEKLLQIVLTGQPELRMKLADPRLRQLQQRIAIAHHVAPLGPAEVRPYLEHRIAVAGGRYEELFGAGTEPIFLAFSRGCPRLLNLLADRALLAAYARELRPVPKALLLAKAREMAAAYRGARVPERIARPAAPVAPAARTSVTPLRPVARQAAASGSARPNGEPSSAVPLSRLVADLCPELGVDREPGRRTLPPPLRCTIDRVSVDSVRALDALTRPTEAPPGTPAPPRAD